MSLFLLFCGTYQVFSQCFLFTIDIYYSTENVIFKVITRVSILIYCYLDTTDSYLACLQCKFLFQKIHSSCSASGPNSLYLMSVNLAYANWMFKS